MQPNVTKRAPFAQAPAAPALTDSKREGNAEKAKLAQHLHEQGINPLRWTEAHPAPQAVQQQFQETGRKARDNQFEVGGKLYDWSPAVSATPAQAKAIAEAYTATPHDPAAARLAPVESLVDVSRVPLTHPLGTPHEPREAATEERSALYRHYAKSGIDPDKAHLGDPLPMRDQERLKAEIAKLLPGDKSEISGLPMFYQGFDDGWVYQANASTQESDEVRKMRVARAGGEGANDNAPELVEQITRHYLDRHMRPESEDPLENSEPSTASPSGDEEKKNDVATEVKALGEQERDNDSAIGDDPKDSVGELKSFVQSMPSIIAVIDKLQAGGTLTQTEKEIQNRISASLKKAGIEFDFTLSDPDQLREVYAQAQKELRKAQQEKEGDASGIAIAMLTLQGTQALAGGSFDMVRMMQSGSMLERLYLAFQRFMPAARKVAVPAITALNVEAAKKGPIDYDAAFKEIHDLFVGNDSASLAPGEISSDEAALTSATSPGIASAGEQMDIDTFKGKLTAFDEVAIHFGDVVLIQHPHTTATDQIFIEELIDAASSMGCEPEPDPTKDRPDKKAIYGGNESQRRITDISQPGHQGSAQPDVGVRLIGHGNRGEVLYNSGSTFADGIRFLGREIQAAYRTIAVQLKQLGATEQELSALANPVRAPSHLFMYRKQWGRKLDEIRQDLRTKIRKAFETYYEDCLPKGPPSIIDLDGIGD